MSDSLPGHFRIPISTGIQNSFRNNVKGLDAYSRHRKFINDYFQYYNGTKDKFKKVEKVKTKIIFLKKKFNLLK